VIRCTFFSEWPLDDDLTALQQKSKKRKKKGLYSSSLKKDVFIQGELKVPAVKRWTLISSKNIRSNLKMVKLTASEGKLKFIGVASEGTHILETDKYVLREDQDGLFYLHVREETGFSRFLLSSFLNEQDDL
ncbi:hypothetical protein PENTCL1PPCAC_11996, partial [Pristionchus entomophagus]